MTAILALAAWPAFAGRAAGVPDPVLAQTPAPLRDDALIRRETIAFEERRIAADPGDQITPRMLCEQYLQRYREQGDVGDLARAEAMARRSLAAQPNGNAPAHGALAGVLTTYHRFREALREVRIARALAPADPGFVAQEASLDLELGDVAAARRLIYRIGDGATPQSEVIASRFDELTGRLRDARTLLDRAAHRVDAVYDAPAERRAWFHVRLGEMAFNGGDIPAAESEERIALARMPRNYQALTDLARFAAARGDRVAQRDAAAAAAEARPEPENLGLLADAADALGDRATAQRARDELDAVRRLGNAQHLWDRFLALYDADHGVNLDEAWTIAQRELRVRDDVFTEDTLAWVAARSGRWDAARAAATKAARLGTEDVRLRAHLRYIHGATAARG